MTGVIAELVRCVDSGVVGPALEHAVKVMGLSSVKAGARTLFMWLAVRYTRNPNWKLRLDPPGKELHAERLLAECRALADLFEVVNEWVDWGPDVPPETGQRSKNICTSTRSKASA
jgi:hypothetical protein